MHTHTLQIQLDLAETGDLISEKGGQELGKSEIIKKTKKTVHNHYMVTNITHTNNLFCSTASSGLWVCCLFPMSQFKMF